MSISTLQSSCMASLLWALPTPIPKAHPPMLMPPVLPSSAMTLGALEQGLSLTQHWVLWDTDAVTSTVRQKGKNWYQEPRVHVALSSFSYFPSACCKTFLRIHFLLQHLLSFFTSISQGPEGYVPAHSVKGVIGCQDISQAHQPARLHHHNTLPPSHPSVTFQLLHKGPILAFLMLCLMQPKPCFSFWRPP